MCCILISNKLQENIEFYNILKSTLISLQNEKNYISIYLINSDIFEDDNKTFSELDKEKPYFLMFFRSIQYEFFNNPINEFIPNIVSKICSINDGYLANISKAFTVKEKQEIPVKEDKKDNISVKNNNKDNISFKNNNKDNISIKNNNKDNISVKNNKKESVHVKNNKKKTIKNIEESIEEKIGESENIDNSENIEDDSDDNTSAFENETNEDIINKMKILKEKQKLLNGIDE